MTCSESVSHSECTKCVYQVCVFRVMTPRRNVISDANWGNLTLRILPSFFNCLHEMCLAAAAVGLSMPPPPATLPHPLGRHASQSENLWSQEQIRLESSRTNSGISSLTTFLVDIAAFENIRMLFMLRNRSRASGSGNKPYQFLLKTLQGCFLSFVQSLLLTLLHILTYCPQLFNTSVHFWGCT